MNKRSEIGNSLNRKSPKQEMLSIIRMWEIYLANESTENDEQTKMKKLKLKVNQLRLRIKPNNNQQFIRKQEDNIKNTKKELQRLKQQKQTLMKLQSNHHAHPINTQIIVMKQSLGIVEKVRDLKAQNRMLFDELRQKQKKLNKQHTQFFIKRIQDRQNSSEKSEQTKTNISNLNKQIQQVKMLKSQTQNQLKKQLQQVDISFNKIKLIVDKKKLVYQQKMKELSKLKAKAQQHDRIKANLDKQRERDKIRQKLNQRRKSLSLKRRNEQSQNEKAKEPRGQEYISGEYINSVPSLDDRQSQSRQVIEQLGRINKIIKNKQLKNFNSIGVGTTFYYNDQDYQF